MAGSRISVPRRIGQTLTGVSGLAVLIGLLVGAPIALLAVAGNPLPDHVPSFDEAFTTLTSRDDGQLFLRALALVGWFGWLTFALSVVVELGALILRVPSPHLPGMRAQQRMAATLLASATLLISTGAAASASALGYGGQAPAEYRVPPVSQPLHTSPSMQTAYQHAPGGQAGYRYAADGQAGYQALAPSYAEAWGVAPAMADGPKPKTDRGGDRERAESDDPVYRVERGDYLGAIADRYLGDFEKYDELATLNDIRDPDLIRAGEFLNLPAEAADGGMRTHATGLVEASPTDRGGNSGKRSGQDGVDQRAGGEGVDPSPVEDRAGKAGTSKEDTGKAGADKSDAGKEETGRKGTGKGDTGKEDTGKDKPRPSPTPRKNIEALPPADLPSGGLPGASGANHADDRGPLPLAVSAVLAAAAVVGAQVGALLGLRERRRKPAE